MIYSSLPGSVIKITGVLALNSYPTHEATGIFAEIFIDPGIKPLDMSVLQSKTKVPSFSYFSTYWGERYFKDLFMIFQFSF